MSKHKMRVLIVAGRTGGHFFPAQTFAQKLLKENPEAEIHFVLSRRLAGKLIEEQIQDQSRIHYLPSFPWLGFFTPKIFRFVFSLLQAFYLSRKILKRVQPDLVVGFGSYLAFPVLYNAWTLKIPSVIHEQNVSLGKANRALIPFVSRVAVSFSDTLDRKYNGKFVHTGNIIRQEFFDLARAGKVQTDKRDAFRILVVGGSQGASSLNQMVVEAFSLIQKALLERLEIIHLTGAQGQSSVEAQYRELGVRASCEAFSHEMGKLYSQADLLIARSGAGTLFETVCFQVPAILIPYPYAGSHQFLNARILARGGNSWVIDQRSQTPICLANQIQHLVESPEMLAHVRERLKNILKIDDGDNLMKLAAGLMKNQESPDENTEVFSESAGR